MDFADFFAKNLKGVPEGERHTFYTTIEKRLRDLHQSKGGAPDAPELMAVVDRLCAARDEFERACQKRQEPAQPDPPLKRFAPLAITRTSDAKAAPPPAVPQPVRRRWATVAAIVAAAVCGALVSSWFSDQSPQPSDLTRHFAAMEQEHVKNVTLLKGVQSAIEEHRRQTGSYPLSGGFVRLTDNRGKWPLVDQSYAAEQSRASRLLYRGSSADYKLIYYLSGDCFVASIRNPELVDQARKAGPVDCIHYGVWTGEARTW